MSIGSRIKEARTRLGLTQVELAKLIGVSKGSVGNYESEVSNPKEPTLWKLMEVLDVDANYLFQDGASFNASKTSEDVEGLAMDFFVDTMLGDNEVLKEFLAKLEDASKFLIDEDWRYISRTVDFAVQERKKKDKD